MAMGIEARNRYVSTKLLEILVDYKNRRGLSTLNPEYVYDALNSFVQNSSLKRKLEMAKSEAREPETHKELAGKLDHAGVIAYIHR